MTPKAKKRVILYGILVSAIHFAAVGFCHAIPTLRLRPEDTNFPPPSPLPRYPFDEAVERIGGVLNIPFDWLWTPWMDYHFHEAIAFLFMVLASCLWGFGLVLAFRFVLSHIRSRHYTAA